MHARLHTCPYLFCNGKPHSINYARIAIPTFRQNNVQYMYVHIMKQCELHVSMVQLCMYKALINAVILWLSWLLRNCVYFMSMEGAFTAFENKFIAFST